MKGIASERPVAVRLLLLNPPSFNRWRYIKEGICQGRCSPSVWPPVTLATIGALAGRIGGIETRLLDGAALHLSEAKLLAALREAAPDAAILSTTTPTFPADLRAAELVKQVRPGCRVAMLGPHVSALPEEAVASPAVDVVFRNEPERIAENWLRALAGGRDWREVRGLTFRRDDGAAVSMPDELFIADLDELPFPDRDLIDNSLYFDPLTGKPFTVIRNSRGCPCACGFCVSFYFGRKWRTRSVENIVAEIDECVERHGVTDFLFNADFFTCDRSAVIDLCDAIVERRLPITWMCNSRVDAVDAELLGAMKRAGCQLISFGIESASQSILDGANKRIDRETIERAIALTRRAGIQSLGYFVFGLPGETRETARDTIRLARRLPLDFAGFFTATPYPGTALYRCLEAEGRLKSRNWTRYDESACDVYDLPDLTGREIRALTREAYRAFYLRPSQIAAELRRFVSPHGLRRAWSLARLFLNLAR